jgi:hypothetical protein
VLALATILGYHFRVGHLSASRRALKILETGTANRPEGLTNATVPYGAAIGVAGVISLVLETAFVR